MQVGAREAALRVQDRHGTISRFAVGEVPRFRMQVATHTLVSTLAGGWLVGYAEAGLIAMLGEVQCYQRFNINRHNSDRGGTRPRLDGTLHDSYFVYLAVKAELL